jgi:steroid delta-isomerase-like uncharacterized protein
MIGRVREEERVVRELYDAFNSRDFDRAAEQFAAQCEYESIAWGSVARTPLEVVEGLRSWATAFPDGQVEMTNVIAYDGFVVVEWLAHGTHTGPLRGEAATGRRFERRGCAVAEVVGGSIVRYRDYFDRANMLEPRREPDGGAVRSWVSDRHWNTTARHSQVSFRRIPTRAAPL